MHSVPERYPCLGFVWNALPSLWLCSLNYAMHTIRILLDKVAIYLRNLWSFPFYGLSLRWVSPMLSMPSLQQLGTALQLFHSRVALCIVVLCSWWTKMKASWKATSRVSGWVASACLSSLWTISSRFTVPSCLCVAIVNCMQFLEMANVSKYIVFNARFAPVFSLEIHR